MFNHSFRPTSFVTLFALAACGGESTAPATPTTSVVAPSVAATSAPQAPKEPTAEEKKAANAKEIATEREKNQADAKAENARWTPELHASAKKLAETKYPTLKAAMDAVLKGNERAPGHAARDKYRHPAETLQAFGITPSMTVLEYGPGEGWYTELLAPTLASKGKLYVTSSDLKGPADSRATLYAERFDLFLAKSPELFGKVERINVDAKSEKIDLVVDGKLDAVLVMRGVHGWINDGKVDAWLSAIQAALKPNGILGIEQHRAKPDATDAIATAKNGYVPEAWLVSKFEAAGFKLESKSEINANPKDTKDYADGVWALPPTLRGGANNRDAFLAIGESDRMTLKFVKAATPGQKSATDPKTPAKTK